MITLRASGMSAKKVKVYVRKPVTSIKLISKSSLKLGKEDITDQDKSISRWKADGKCEIVLQKQ